MLDVYRPAGLSIIHKIWRPRHAFFLGRKLNRFISVHVHSSSCCSSCCCCCFSCCCCCCWCGCCLLVVVGCCCLNGNYCCQQKVKQRSWVNSCWGHGRRPITQFISAVHSMICKLCKGLSPGVGGARCADQYESLLFNWLCRFCFKFLVMNLKWNIQWFGVVQDGAILVANGVRTPIDGLTNG